MMKSGIFLFLVLSAIGCASKSPQSESRAPASEATAPVRAAQAALEKLYLGSRVNGIQVISKDEAPVTALGNGHCFQKFSMALDNGVSCVADLSTMNGDCSMEALGGTLKCKEADQKEIAYRLDQSSKVASREFPDGVDLKVKVDEGARTEDQASPALTMKTVLQRLHPGTAISSFKITSTDEQMPTMYTQGQCVQEFSVGLADGTTCRGRLSTVGGDCSAETVVGDVTCLEAGKKDRGYLIERSPKPVSKKFPDGIELIITAD